jgi:hypothetical protein
MSTEESAEHLRGLPVEEQRKVLSLIQRNIGHCLGELSLIRLTDENVVSGSGGLVALQSKIAALLLEVDVLLAASDSELPDQVHSGESATRLSEEPETLLAHRGSIVVSGKQDFTAIRKKVINQHVQEEIVERD